MKAHALVVVMSAAVSSVACGGDGNDGSSKPTTPEVPQATEFAANAPPPGYTRYYTTPVTLAPGANGIWAQWVAPAFDTDMDVVDIQGDQTKGGHHALMYSSKIDEAPGFTREWRDEDQISTRFLGGVGGEAGSNAKLPPGVVFRLPKGQSLLIQTHYVNTTRDTLSGRTYLDVKFGPVSDTARVAAIFSSTTVAIDAKPGGDSSGDVNCTTGSDLELLMFSNHMHEWGKAVVTTATLPDGTVKEIKRDDAWNYEWQSNPNFTHEAVDAPLRLPAGTKLNTHCTWTNTGTEHVRFPDEMCVFFGFFYGKSDIICVDGTWTPN